jgi:hypothetical protein
MMISFASNEIIHFSHNIKRGEGKEDLMEALVLIDA